MRLGVGGVRGRPGDVDCEGDVLFERRLQVGLGVLELELARPAASPGVREVHLGHPGQDPEAAVSMVDGVAVGDVELGGDVGVIGERRPRRSAGDRRLLVSARQRPVDRVVGGLGLDLERRRVEEQLGGRVVVDHQLEAHPPHQPVQGPGLGLGGRLGPAVGLRVEVRGGALLVVVPPGREVAVQIDSIGGGDLAIVVVVAQVLAPEPVSGRKREVVAVGVGDDDEPQLAAVDEPGQRPRTQPPHRSAVGPQRAAAATVVVDEQMCQPPHHLRRDPLASMLGGEVDCRRLGSGSGSARVAGHPQGQDRHTADRGSDHDRLHEAAVAAPVGERQHLLVEGLAPVAPGVAADVAGRGRAGAVEVGAVDVV